MTQRQKIQLFEDKKVRTAWDDQEEKWYFSIVDVCAVLSESENPQTYWRVLKNRLKKEGNETVTDCNALKMLAPDGKMRLTDVADESLDKQVVDDRRVIWRMQRILRMHRSKEWKKEQIYRILTEFVTPTLESSIDMNHELVQLSKAQRN